MAYRTQEAHPRESALPPQSHTQKLPRLPLDHRLLLRILLLALCGTVMIASASYANALARYGDSGYYIKRQLLWLLLGGITMWLCSRIPPQYYARYAPAAYGVTLFCLVLVLLIGESGGGARRWIALGPVTFQPSELAKTTLVLLLGRHFATHREIVLDTRRHWPSFCTGTLVPLCYIALVCGAVALEKHLSCLIILGALGVCMMLAGGSRSRPLLLFGAFGVAGVTALALFTDYTKRRILIWQDPAAYPLDGGWQTLQGMMAIGSGGLFGLGLGNSRLKYSYVSEPQNDFIFTITCEELGFLGALAVLTLFFLFAFRAYKLALRHPAPFCGLVMFGITTKVVLQVLLNIAVVTNSIPNTGISLPFFSYGGSSLVMLFAEMGILLSLSRTAGAGP